MSLYQTTTGDDVDDIVFAIADQIMLGIDKLTDKGSEFRLDIAILYELVGIKAVVCSDFTASRAYFICALSLLPTNHWTSNYEMSLRCSLLCAKSYYSAGDMENAMSILQDIIGHCTSLQDKLPVYYLLQQSKCQSLFTTGLTIIHYLTCAILSSQLN